MASAEDWAHQAAQAAQRSSVRAEAATNAVLEVQQAVGRMERELRETRAAVTVGLTSVRDRLVRLETKVRPATTVTHEDFEETSTGSYKINRDTFTKLLDEHQLHEDGHKWRRTWRKVRGLVWAIAGGAAALAGEQGVAWLVRHL